MSTQAFHFQIVLIWKGPLPHKYTPVWVTYVRESLGGVTGVGGDPNQSPYCWGVFYGHCKYIMVIVTSYFIHHTFYFYHYKTKMQQCSKGAST